MSSYNVKSGSIVSDKKTGHSSFKLLAPVPFISSNVTNPLRSWCSVKFGDQRQSKTDANLSIKHANEAIKSERTSFFQRRTDKLKRPLDGVQTNVKIPLAIVAPFKKSWLGCPRTNVQSRDKQLDGSARLLSKDVNKQSELGQKDKNVSSSQNTDHLKRAVQKTDGHNFTCINKEREKIPERTVEQTTADTCNIHERSKQPRKIDHWLKTDDHQAKNNVPVWARDKKSPLHSQIQKARELYDDMAKQQKEEKEKKSISAIANYPKNGLKLTNAEASSQHSTIKLNDKEPPAKVKTTKFEDRLSTYNSEMGNDGRNTTGSFKLPQSPITTAQHFKDKSQSLPGFYNPPPPRQNIQGLNQVTSERGNKPSWNNQTSLKIKNPEVNPVKSYKHIFGNLFHRKKKELSEELSSFSGEDSENSHGNDGGFNKINNVKQRKTLQNSHYENIIIPQSMNNKNLGIEHQYRNMQYPRQNLTRVFSHEEISRNSPHASTKNKYNLRNNSSYLIQRKLVPSISYDSLPASGISMNSESAYGSINSIQSQPISKGESSPAMDSVTHRERREAIMAKVKKIRDKQVNSSSEEDQVSHSSLSISESSSKMGFIKRKSKTSRTERYLRRKSQECENLRKESERDKRTKALVQARINEIQLIKSQESKKSPMNSSHIANKDIIREKPRWSAQLIYQESNEYDSVIIPSPIPISGEVISNCPSRYESASKIDENKLPNLKTNLLSHNKITNENNFNRTSNIKWSNRDLYNQSNFRVAPTVKGGTGPPDPPPRDASRFVSPRELHRPLSYSFENIHHRLNTYNQPIGHTKTQFSPSPTCSNYIDRSTAFKSNGSKRALSEQKLYQPTSPVVSKRGNISSQNAYSFNCVAPPKPLRASVTLIPGKDQKLSMINSISKFPSQTNISELNSSLDGRTHIPITNIPPSPSSDYASYVSENSSMVTNLSSPRLVSRQEFREKVTEGSLERNQPNSTPIKFIKSNSSSQGKPDPPRRDFSSLNKGSKEFLRQTLKHSVEDATILIDERKLIEEAYQMEKDKIIKSKCSNLGQAINELEELYNNLDLNSDDILDRAERRDLPTEHQLMWGKNSENSSSLEKQCDKSSIALHKKTPKLRRSCTPDKVTDDVHYRRCLQAKPKPFNKPDLPSASYMLFSPVHSPTLDSDETYIQNGMVRNEPNITSDDVTYRNVQRANAIKIINPQPPFGIPLGPLTQGSSTDYLHLQAKENYKPVLTSRKYPDVIMDDMAFRNLRKDNSLSDKSLNLSELDSILSEPDIITKPKRNLRSISLDRLSHNTFSNPGNKKIHSIVPRQIRNLKRKNTKSKFFDGYKGALTDSETTAIYNSTPRNQEFDKCIQKLSQDSIDSRKETITDNCSSNLIKRSAIIDESKLPAGAPSLMMDDDADNPFKDTSRSYASSTILDDSVESKCHLNKAQLNAAVDICKLNDLISTINNSEVCTDSETNNNSASAILKNSKLKSVIIRPNSNSELRKGNAISLIDAGNHKGTSKQEAESLARRLHCKESSVAYGLRSDSRVKELDKRNRRLEYEKQRVAGLKKTSPEKEKFSKAAERPEDCRSNREASKRRLEYIQSRSSDVKSGKFERGSPDGESDKLKSRRADENDSKILSQNLTKMVYGSSHISTSASAYPRTNANSHDNSGAERNNDVDRRERIQRYKEERRRQMALRYGTAADLSSSDEEKLADSSSNVARRRKRGKPAIESSSTEVSTTESKKNYKNKDRSVRKSSEVDSIKSSNNSDSFHKSGNLSFNNNEKVGSHDDSVYQVKRRVAEQATVQKIVQDSQEAASSGGSESKVTRRRSSGSKDKSHKRKSNLNRAPSEEPTPDAVHAIDDSKRRRRRRSDNILGTFSPELTSVQLVANVSSSSSCQSVSAPRMSEGSSGCDLKSKKHLSGDVGNKTILGQTTDGKKQNSRQSLKKPEIPETLRTKEIRIHQRTLQGQDRPPVGPESGKNPTMSLNAQRKSQDYGACFMSNKRDKINISQLKKDNAGQADRLIDRTSESDQSKESMNDHIDNLTAQAKSLIARVENMSNVPEDSNLVTDRTPHVGEKNQSHTNATSLIRRSKDSYMTKDQKDKINDCDNSRSQKRTESKRLAFRDTASTEEVSGVNLSSGVSVQSVSFEDDRRSRKDGMPNMEYFFQKGSRGSSVDSESPRVNSPEPHSILKRKSSREEQLSFAERSTTPEPQSILKKKPTSRTSSSDNLDCDPRPILKKKNSTEDLEYDEPKPKPILKKKSLTDDELELSYVLPRSILKGARSGEDLPRTDGVISPASILKRFSKTELDYEGDLKPILKRRQTTDGVRRSGNNSDSENESRYRLRSDSAPEAVALLSRSPPVHRVTPRHGILKNSRNSRSVGIEDSELSVLLRHRRKPADDMSSDSLHLDVSNRAVSPSLNHLMTRKTVPERPLSVADRIAGMEALKLPSFDASPTSTNSQLIPDENNSAGALSPTIRDNNHSVDDEAACQMPSRVSQRAAFFAQLERNSANGLQSSEDNTRKGRGARFATQPVTDTEVNEAARRVDSPGQSTTERYGSLDNIQKQPCVVNNDIDKKDAPKSILKSDFIRKLSNDDHLKSILKNESPQGSLVTSPEQENRPLKSVLKKDSSIDDNKEIKSILKRQSESLEPDASSDSSSDPIKEAENVCLPEVKSAKSRNPFMVTDNWAEALRNIAPVRHKELESQPSNTGPTEIEVDSKSYETRTDRSGEILNERTAFEEDALIFGESNPWELRGLSRLRGINAVSITEATNSQLVSDNTETSFENSVISDKAMLSEDNLSYKKDPSSDSEADLDGTVAWKETALMRNKTTSQNYDRYAEVTGSSSGIAATEDTSEVTLNDGVHTSTQRFESIKKETSALWSSSVQKRSEDAVDTEGLLQRKARPTSLLERVTQLETSSQLWKNRVEQSDATQFTVAHRMTSSSTSSVPNAVLMGPPRSPSIERVRRTPQPKVFKSKTGGNIPDLLGSVRKELFARSHSQPSDAKGQSEAVVSVPNPDDEHFNAFFSSSSTMKRDPIDLDIGSFDHVTRDSSQLLVNRRNVRVTRRQQSSMNPLRALARRQDLKSEYTEVKLGVGDRELRRMKVEEISKSSSFAMEALAGLASKENFNAISLKKVAEKPLVREMPTYLDLMLIQVKGRRHAQVKLVAPRPQSVNAGDDFILVTPHEVFHFKGEFANVIERAVCSEIVSYILQTKDMGVTQECRVAEVNCHSVNNAQATFWKCLGGNSSSNPASAGLPNDDDLYEASIVSSNKIYEVIENSLVPVREAWGQSPKYQLLSSDKVFVFDFGSEVYLWAGKFAASEVRRNGASLLKELWQEEFDYSDCDINPISMTLKEESVAMKGKRPEWGICGKITENVETILFKEKFVDWPDTAQRSRRKEAEKELMNKPEPVCELIPCDVSEMIDNEPASPDLVLEMSHLGRGVEYYDDEERRLLCISTKDVKIWQISENEKNFVDKRSFGHFYAGETYVVRWYYVVTATGRTLKGTPSKHNMTGRTRVAYFFWQGSGSSVSDKGVSALMTVELDEERGPHIRVPMGSEQPAFLNLFNGGLVYHSGHTFSRDPVRMFMVRGNRENEAHLVEIVVTARHLRSKGCLVVADLKNGMLYLWVGSKSAIHTRKIASHAAERFSRSTAPEIRWKVIPATVAEQHEGKESIAFLQLFDNLPLSSAYYSLLDRPSGCDWTQRVWKFDATRGKFEAIEITSTYRCSVFTPFPVVQEQLYGSIQPGLFLVDSGDKVWVWQGWWPDSRSGSDSSRAATGSAQLRFTFARRAAFQTALNYVQQKSRGNKRKSINLDPGLVVAGMEPMEFCNLFPIWEENAEIQKLQEKEGRYSTGRQYSVKETLQELLKTRYSLEELVRYPRPDGIDQLHLEKYLSKDEFKMAIGMNKTTFHALPEWKQVEVKKKANLF